MRQTRTGQAPDENPPNSPPEPSRAGRKPRFKVADVEAALIASAGVLAHAAEILAETYKSCDRGTVRNYIERHPQLRRVVDETVEVTLDRCERKLISALDSNTEWAIRFYLETKGKHRGYSKRHEITGANGKPIEVSDARERFISQLIEIGARLGPLPNGDPGEAGGGRPNGVDAVPAPAEQ